MQVTPSRFRIRVLVLLSVLTLFVCVCSLKAQTAPPPAQNPAQTKSAGPQATPVLQSATKATEPTLFPKDMIVLKVGDNKFTVEDFSRLLEIFPAQQRSYYNGPGRRRFAEDFSQLLALADEAKRQKLDQDPTVKQRIELAINQALAQSLVQRFQEDARISDEDLKKYYDAHLKDFEQVKVSHILIRVKGSAAPVPTGKKDLTEDEAKAKAEEIYRQVVAPGADFAAIAKAESYDSGSVARGGDLGTFGHGRMVQPFEEAAFALKPGEISHPVKSQFGYHIIRVDEKKTRSMEETKSEIETALRPQKVEKSIEEIRKAAKVEINDAFFPPPPVQAPAAPAATGSATPPPAPSSPPAEKKK